MSSPSGQPSIELFGLQIMEPVVTLTDFLITGVCVYAFVQLSKKNLTSRAHGICEWHWQLFLVVYGHALQATRSYLEALDG